MGGKVGIFIFQAAVVVEIAFAAFCVITESSQQKIRSIIRVAALTILLPLIMLQIIDWSPRYYALGVLLLILAVIGIVDLIRRKEEKKDLTKQLVLF